MRPRHHGNNKGPKLPGQLLKAVGGDGAAPGGRKRGLKKRASDSRKEARKAARQDKKHRRLISQQQRSKRPAPDEQGAPAPTNKRLRQPESEPSRHDGAAAIRPQAPAAKATSAHQPDGTSAGRTGAPKARIIAGALPQKLATTAAAQQPPAQRQQQAAGSKKTRFFELLEPKHSTLGTAGSSREAFLADLRTEREMQRLLKLKKKKKSTGVEDGLEELLSGITAGEQLLPSFMTGAAGMPGSDDADDGSLEDGTNDGSEEEHSSDDDADEGAFWDDSEDEGEAGSGDADASDDDSEGAEIDAADMEEGESGGDEDQGSSEADGDGSDGEEGSDGEGNAAARRRAASLYGDAGPSGAATGGRYVPPALRAAAGNDRTAQLERRLTGLLNRLAEANLQGIVKDVAGLYAAEGRRLVAELTAQLLLQAVSEGPRASEQYAAITATFVAGLSAEARAQDIAARFLEQLATKLEAAYVKHDSLAQHNLVMVAAYCYSCGLVAADLMYSILSELQRRFTESDVAMMVTLLNAVGLQLRSDDPAAMKDFVVSVHERAAEVTGAQGAGMSKRAQLMLELVVDIKNNRPRSAVKAAAAAAAGGGGAAARKGGAAAVVEPGTLKWLRGAGVADVQLANLSWAKLLMPNKKGTWWLPAATDARDGLLPGGMPAGLLPDAHDGGGASAAGAGTAHDLLQLAAAQRMNTDVRRAVFVAIMGSEDCVEAFEKLTRLPLKGEQDREVMRVLLDCCLQEQGPNPYYALLAAKLVQHSKGHKMTLQHSLWDKLKELPNMDARVLSNLSHFLASLVASQALPLAVVKSANFTVTTSPKELFFWRIFFLQLLRSSKPTGNTPGSAAAVPFIRLASQPALGAVSKAMASFLCASVGPWLSSGAAASLLAGKGSRGSVDVDVLLQRLEAAERVLTSSVSARLAA